MLKWSEISNHEYHSLVLPLPVYYLSSLLLLRFLRLNIDIYISRFVTDLPEYQFAAYLSSLCCLSACLLSTVACGLNTNSFLLAQQHVVTTQRL